MAQHYAFISASIWLYIESLYVHYAVTAGRLRGRALKCYIPMGWIAPAPVLGLTILCAGLAPYGADWRCFMNHHSPAIYAFLVPVLGFSTVCLILFLDILQKYLYS